MTDGPKPEKRARGQKMTAELWESLVDFWRRNPRASASATAAAVGVDRRTARRAYLEGLPYDFAATPIQKFLAAESTKTRVALAAFNLQAPPAPKPGPGVKRRGRAKAPGAATPDPEGPPAGSATPLEERELARADALGTRAAEAKLVRAARGNILGLLEATDHLVSGARYIAEEAIKGLKDAPEFWKKNPIDGVRIVHDIAKIARLAVQSSLEVVEMERKLLGDPGDVADPANMTAEQATAELEEAAKMLERTKRRGLTLIKGGDEPPPAPPPPDPQEKAAEP